MTPIEEKLDKNGSDVSDVSEQATSIWRSSCLRPAFRRTLKRSKGTRSYLPHIVLRELSINFEAYRYLPIDDQSGQILLSLVVIVNPLKEVY